MRSETRSVVLSELRGRRNAKLSSSHHSPLTANIYFPVIPAIADDLNVSVEQINLTGTSLCPSL